jgi:hypothetical protein
MASFRCDATVLRRPNDKPWLRHSDPPSCAAPLGRGPRSIGQSVPLSSGRPGHSGCRAHAWHCRADREVDELTLVPAKWDPVRRRGHAPTRENAIGQKSRPRFRLNWPFPGTDNRRWQAAYVAAFDIQVQTPAVRQLGYRYTWRERSRHSGGWDCKETPSPAVHRHG